MTTYIKQAASRIKLHKYASAAKCIRRQRAMEKYAYFLKQADEEDKKEESKSDKKDDKKDGKKGPGFFKTVGGYAGAAAPTVGGVGLGSLSGYGLAKLFRAKHPWLWGLGGGAVGGLAVNKDPILDLATLGLGAREAKRLTDGNSTMLKSVRILPKATEDRVTPFLHGLAGTFE